MDGKSKQKKSNDNHSRQAMKYLVSQSRLEGLYYDTTIVTPFVVSLR